MNNSLMREDSTMPIGSAKTFIMNNITSIKNIVYNGSAEVTIEKNYNKLSMSIISDEPILCEIQQDNLYIKSYTTWSYCCCICFPTFTNKNEYTTIWKINSLFCIDKINLVGSGTLNLKNNNYVDKHLCSTLTGSGNLLIHNVNIVDVDITLTGSGDLKFITSNCDTVKVNLIGSGDITTPSTKLNAYCRLTGSGDIKCIKSVNCNVVKHIIGSGNIN